jgi:hypothetical protein
LGSRYYALRLARRFRHALHRLQALPNDAPGLTLAEVLALHGGASMSTWLILWSLFSILPVGGVGNVAAMAMWWLAWDWWRGRTDVRLPSRLVDTRISMRWSRATMRTLAIGYRSAGRWMRPRWPRIQAPWTVGPWALWMALQALVIFLPIPMGNVLPAFSLVAMGLGILLKDGVMLVVSLAWGILGLLYTAALWHLTWMLTVQSWHWLVGRFV